jgi:hypothetical protein
MARQFWFLPACGRQGNLSHARRSKSSTETEQDFVKDAMADRLGAELVVSPAHRMSAGILSVCFCEEET